MSMMTDIAKYSFSGGRQINEDSVYAGNGLYIVADGLGGHYGGEIASSAAVSYMSGNYSGDMSDSGIDALLEGANQAVCSLNNGSHTTVAAAFLGGGKFRCANVGDSRVYYFRKNKVFTVTKDHSVCRAAVDMGEMSYEDIRFSEDRSRLLKVLGSEARLNLRTQYKPIQVMDGDAFLICSDGFWEYVHEREMEADLLKADSADSWARLMLKRQLLKARDEGDNYTVVCGIIHCDGTDAVPSSEAATEQFPADAYPAADAPAIPPTRSGVPSDIPATGAVPTAAKPGSGSKKGIIAAIIIGAVIIAAGVVTAALLISNGSKPENSPEITGTSEAADTSAPSEPTAEAVIKPLKPAPTSEAGVPDAPGKSTGSPTQEAPGVSDGSTQEEQPETGEADSTAGSSESGTAELPGNSISGGIPDVASTMEATGEPSTAEAPGISIIPDGGNTLAGTAESPETTEPDQPLPPALPIFPDSGFAI